MTSYSLLGCSEPQHPQQFPQRWKLLTLKQIANVQLSNVDKLTNTDEVPVQLCNYVDVYKNDFIGRSRAFMAATATSTEIARFQLQSGDVLVTKDSEAWNDIGVPALVTEDLPGVLCGYHLAMIRPDNRQVTGPYLYWVLESQHGALQFHAAASGVTRYGVSKADIKNVTIPVPPIDEQSSIADFLHAAQIRLARLIRNKRRLITLLNEEKQAIIQQAVTRGLDPDVPLKPSGVEWLGDIPAHWDTINLGRVIELTTGFPFPSQLFLTQAEGIRLLRGVNVTPGKIRWDTTVTLPHSESERYTQFELRDSDIVLGMDRPIISSGVRVARVHSHDLPALLVQRVARIRPTQRLNPDFLLLHLSGKSFSDYMAPIFTGISVPHLSPAQISAFTITLPSRDEQDAILGEFQQESSKIETLIASTHREISLIREYRTRLISDVVTGQLDVRDVQFDDDFSVENLDLSDVELLDEEDVTSEEIDEISDEEDSAA